MRIFRTLTVIASLFSLLFPCLGAAQEVTLAWDPNTEPNVAGYKLYYRAASPDLPLDGIEALEGDSPIDVADQTTTTVTLPDDGQIYYFAVTAYDTAGYESSYSNIVASDPTNFPKISVSPQSVEFGTVKVGQIAEQTVTITNEGLANLEIGDVLPEETPSEGENDFFIVDDLCSQQTLGPAVSCTFTLIFQPATVGDSSGSFNITSNDQGANPFVLAVSGSGSPQPVPAIAITLAANDINLSPHSLTIPFGELQEGLTRNAQVTISNHGTADLAIDAIFLAKDQSGFEITVDGFPQAIAPEDFYSFPVTFAPTMVGLFSDEITILTNDPEEDKTIISLSGEGLSSLVNNPPTKPALTYPLNGQEGLAETITFRWLPCQDPDGSNVTYEFYISEDPEFSYARPSYVFQVGNRQALYTGIGSSALLLLGIGLPLAIHGSRRKLVPSLVILTLALTFLASCGGGGGGDSFSGNGNNLIGGDGTPPSNEESHTISALNSNTDYYWKVVAVDEEGESTESEVRRFKTENQ